MPLVVRVWLTPSRVRWRGLPAAAARAVAAPVSGFGLLLGFALAFALGAVTHIDVLLGLRRASNRQMRRLGRPAASAWM
jgi:hypothetical protein